MLRAGVRAPRRRDGHDEVLGYPDRLEAEAIRLLCDGAHKPGLRAPRCKPNFMTADAGASVRQCVSASVRQCVIGEGHGSDVGVIDYDVKINPAPARPRHSASAK